MDCKIRLREKLKKTENINQILASHLFFIKLTMIINEKAHMEFQRKKEINLTKANFRLIDR